MRIVSVISFVFSPPPSSINACHFIFSYPVVPSYRFATLLILTICAILFALSSLTTITFPMPIFEDTFGVDSRTSSKHTPFGIIFQQIGLHHRSYNPLSNAQLVNIFMLAPSSNLSIHLSTDLWKG